MQTRYSKFLRTLLLASALATAAVHAGTPTHAAAVTVEITNYKFDAPALRISPGTTVTWTNRDEAPHTVTSTDKRFVSSAALDTGDSFSYTFNAPGTYAYYCTLHPFMTGKVIVQVKARKEPGDGSGTDDIGPW